MQSSTCCRSKALFDAQVQTARQWWRLGDRQHKRSRETQVRPRRLNSDPKRGEQRAQQSRHRRGDFKRKSAREREKDDGTESRRPTAMKASRDRNRNGKNGRGPDVPPLARRHIPGSFLQVVDCSETPWLLAQPHRATHTPSRRELESKPIKHACCTSRPVRKTANGVPRLVSCVVCRSCACLVVVSLHRVVCCGGEPLVCSLHKPSAGFQGFPPSSRK